MHGEGISGFFCKNQFLRNVVLGEALVVPPYSTEPFKRISAYRPRGLNPPFPSNFLKKVTVDNAIYGDLEAITQGVSVGNQEQYFDNLCAVVPIHQYQIRGKDGSLGPIVKTNRAKDCIALKTATASLLVELVWVSSDDLDLSLIEPTGFKISRFYPVSKSSGRLLDDGGDALVCLPLIKNGYVRESIRYKTNFPPTDGKYTILVEHYRNCKQGSTPYTIRIVSQGVVLKEIKGSSDLNRRALVASPTFEVVNGTVIV